MTNPPTDERGESVRLTHKDGEVLDWIRERLVNVHGDDTNADFIHAIERVRLRVHAQAALSHQGEVEGWRPIETAPEGVPCIVGWIDEGDECVEFDTLEEGVWQMHYGGWEHFISVAPPGSRGASERAPYTHWMPLPSVPTSNLTALISKAEKV